MFVVLHKTIFAMPKRASDNYIQLDKTITNKEMIKSINALAAKWFVSNQAACYRLITEGIERQKELEEKFKKIMNNE
jgi:hypothetical protein